jgi:hypothetical protein
MLVGLSGPTITLSTGHEADFPQDEALRLIAAGYAVPVAEKKAEKAVKSKAKVETR